jgi:hypothetical protein
VRAVHSSVEDADVPRGLFHLGVTATWFHWLDRDVAYPKAATGAHSGRPPGGLVAAVSDPRRPDPIIETISSTLGYDFGGQRTRTPFQLDEPSLSRRRSPSFWATCQSVRGSRRLGPRWAAVTIAAAKGEACICDLNGRSQPTVSPHARLPIKACLAIREQRPKWAYSAVFARSRLWQPPLMSGCSSRFILQPVALLRASTLHLRD